MKIVRVTARGFKTYRDTTVIGEFDDRLNCIVGLNGSGKSSLFQAIIFVLSPDMHSPSLLHEGSTGKIQSGFVEIEFNSPSIQSLRRTITVSDTTGGGFMVNGNHVSKSDYATLLQSVGLLGGTKRSSSSTPYFVVEQGRVVSVATISDKQRFDLIKEACGIDVFTSKKIEAIKIFSDTESKREKIDEVMTSIDSRCDQLERESLQLTEYARLEKERDYIEFQIGTVEIENLNEKKIEISSEIDEMKKKAQLIENDIVSLSTRKLSLEKNQEGSVEMNEIKIRVSQLRELKNELLSKMSQLSNQLVLETENREKSATAISGFEKQLIAVNERRVDVAAQIEKDRGEMEKLRSEIGVAKKHQSDCLIEIKEIEQMGSSVEDLQNRKNQLSLIFSSLDLRSRNLESLRKTKQGELEKIVQEEIPFAETRLKTVNEEINRIESNCESKRSKIRSIEDEKTVLENKLFGLKGQKMYSHQKQIEILTKELNTLSSGVFRGDKKLLSVDSKEGWISSGIRGLFGDFIKIPSHYRRAVELCSKNVLFNLVIDSDEIADKLVGKFGGSKLGRLTLFPLNRVGDCQTESDLVARIESDHEFKDKVKVLSSVITGVENEEWVNRLILKFFSKVVIVENVEVGFAISKKYKVETVTPDGDIISKHLILRSSSNWSSISTTTTTTMSSVVSSWQQIISIRKKLVLEKSQMSNVLSEIKLVESQLSECMDELEKLGSEVISVPSNLIAEQNSLKKNLQEIGQRRTDFESFEIPTILGEIDELKSEKNRIETELAMVNNQLLNPSETGRRKPAMSQSERDDKVAILSKRITELKTEIESNEQIVVRLSRTISVNQSELVHFIGNKKESLEELIRERKSSIEFIERNIQKLKQGIENFKLSELNVVETELADLLEKEVVETEKMSSYRVELESVIRELEDVNKQVGLVSDLVLQKERKLQRIEAEISSVRMNSIRQLSSIPTDGFVSTNLGELKSRMISVVKLMNSDQYELLNKNALEQYEKISSERNQLISRKTEIEESDKAIRSLLNELNIKELKMVKDAFVKIKSSFETLFRRVTNGVGKAEIEMDLNQGSDKSAMNGSLRIRVGFPGEPNAALDWKSMAELSGGQRTVVALCFLISLHRANESAAKFFILDEVDAALDSVYRFGIAEAVRQESRENETQFLFTSFRAELASAADRHFLVTMSRGTSRVDSVDLPTALSLVNLNEEDADKSEPNRRTTMVAVRE